MKKRIAILSLLLVLLLAASGCLRMRATVTLRKSGKIDFEMLYAMNSLGLEFGGEMIGDEELAEFQQQGFTCKPYTDGDYSGFIIAKENMDPDTEELPDFGEDFTIKAEGDTYTVDIPWSAADPSGYAEQIVGISEYIKEYGGFCEIVVVLPEKPTEHNATSVSEDGKTLTWNLLEMGDRTSLHVVCTVRSSILPSFDPVTPGGDEKNWVKTVCICLGLVLVGAVVFFIIRKAVKNKKAREADAMDGNPYETKY